MMMLLLTHLDASNTAEAEAVADALDTAGVAAGVAAAGQKEKRFTLQSFLTPLPKRVKTRLKSKIIDEHH